MALANMLSDVLLKEARSLIISTGGQCIKLSQDLWLASGNQNYEQLVPILERKLAFINICDTPAASRMPVPLALAAPLDGGSYDSGFTDAGMEAQRG